LLVLYSSPPDDESDEADIAANERLVRAATGALAVLTDNQQEICLKITTVSSNLDIQTYNLDIQTYNPHIQTYNLDIQTYNLDIQTYNLDIQTYNLDIQTYRERYVLK